MTFRRRYHKATMLFLWVILLGAVFANVEIQIEGGAGWAANLPTWRLENSWLNWFWGGKTITGYHAWVFSFMALVFHIPLFVGGIFSWRLEARILGSVMVFWIVEDFLWFVFNPAFGFGKFSPQFIPWHKHWLLGVPVDYLLTITAGLLLISWSWKRKSPVTSTILPRPPL
ncbi:MAG: hypothetical protein WCI20_04415 [bacterium]